jgi:hypothetical protein
MSYSVDNGVSGNSIRCTRCGHTLRITMHNNNADRHEIATQPLAHSGSLCPLCRSPICQGDSISTCPECKTMYHEECWSENRGCGIYGCPQVPETEKLRTVEISTSFWGREDKPCPACNAIILASAIRCRHCGATFKSASPEDANSYQEQKAIEQILPQLQRSSILLLIFCIIPFTAPIAAIFGYTWYWSHRIEIKALPRIYSAISKIALCLGTGQTFFMILIIVIFARWNT